MCIRNFFNDYAQILHTSTGVNSDGCPVETTTATETVACFMSTLSGNKMYVNSVSGHYVTKQLWLDSPIQPLYESFYITFLTGCLVSGNLEITLGSELTVTIPLTSTGHATPTLVASAISSATYTNWTVTSLDATVTFTASVGGVQTPSVVDTNSTGVTMSAATFIEVGTDGANVIELTDKIVHKGTTYHVENVDTIIDKGMGQYVDLSVFK
jgi:hypothetical protein